MDALPRTLYLEGVPRHRNGRESLAGDRRQLAQRRAVRCIVVVFGFVPMISSLAGCKHASAVAQVAEVGLALAAAYARESDGDRAARRAASRDDETDPYRSDLRRGRHRYCCESYGRETLVVASNRGHAARLCGARLDVETESCRCYRLP